MWKGNIVIRKKRINKPYKYRIGKHAKKTSFTLKRTMDFLKKVKDMIPTLTKKNFYS